MSFLFTYSLISFTAIDKEFPGVDEREERSIDVSELTTTPNANGKAPLSRRKPKGLLPSTWLDRPVRVEYIAAGGEDGAANVSDKPLSAGEGSSSGARETVVISKGARENLGRTG